MKTKNLLTVLFFLATMTGYSKVWHIVNVGATFSPANITIALGDSVNFDISSPHDGTEVSLATWNANASTPLSGGFKTPVGGGMVLPAQLAIGTHHFVCTPHASMGMKGTIVVQNNATGIKDIETQNAISVFPNPSKGLIKSVSYTHLTLPTTPYV